MCISSFSQDASCRVRIYHRSEDKRWRPGGKYKSNAHGQIKSLVFLPPRQLPGDDLQPRLFSIGTDNRLIEYCITR